jgi:hypothetical protein
VPGLLVVGVGRSGTSAATQLIASLGLRPPGGVDLMDGDQWNPSGYWESRSLMTFNDALLARLDASWWTPPAVVDPTMLGVLDDQVESARAAFGSVFPDGSAWVWKDPRLTVLLPFWDRVLGTKPVVLPYRQPDPVAASIARRDGVTTEQALAIWERHTRLLLKALAGRPALALSFDLLVSEPGSWRGAVVSFCEGTGLPVVPPTGPAADLVQPSGRERGTAGLTVEQAALYALVRSLDGSHATFPDVELPPESANCADLLASVRFPAWWRATTG